MSRRRRSGRHRWSARLAALGGLVVLPAAAAGIALATPDPAPDPEAVLVDQLAAEGESVDVIECTLRLGDRQLRIGRLDDRAVDELVTSCRAANDAIVVATADPPDELASVDRGPWTFGDDVVLDGLWSACEAGDGEACDRLFETGPVGSDYEAFGLTCGDRPDVLDCRELDAAES
ncbi:MAG: hypothetical protein AAGA93_19675 [Actinomycetota bacterium]